MPNPLGSIIGGGIGLASEAYHHHKQQKATKRTQSFEAESSNATPPSYDDSIGPQTFVVAHGESLSTLGFA